MKAFVSNLKRNQEVIEEIRKELTKKSESTPSLKELKGTVEDAFFFQEFCFEVLDVKPKNTHIFIDEDSKKELLERIMKQKGDEVYKEYTNNDLGV